jgi:high-affinity nickel permease
MLPIGFLFGLGFDTASEVALLALAALAPKVGGWAEVEAPKVGWLPSHPR